MNFFDKLRAFATNFGGISVLANALNIAQPSLSRYLKGDVKPGFEFIQKLYILGCDINWLLDDTDTRSYEELEKDKLSEEVAKTYIPTLMVKLYEGLGDYDGKISVGFAENQYRLHIVDEISVVGMHPLLHIGDYVITDLRVDPIENDLVLIKYQDNITGDIRYIVKYFKQIINDSIAVFTALNNENIYIDINTIFLVHKITWIKYPVDNRITLVKKT